MVHVITDSTSSLPADIKDELGIETVSLIINRSGKEYIEAETDLDEFYKDIYEMVDDIPSSSQPPLSVVHAALERAAAAGEEVIGIFLSSKMSGTFESFLQSAKEVRASHPGFRFAAVDSMSNCLELGFPVIAAAKAAKIGSSLEECVKAAKASIHSTRFIFAPESLTFLEAGGRIGKAAALIGNLISISPVLTVKDGEASTLDKVRSQKKAMAKMVQTLQEDIAEHGLKNLVVHYIGDKAPAKKWADETIAPLLGFQPRVLPASPVIGVHVGPAMGLAYECERPITGKFHNVTPEIVI